jgi:thymidylate kinase
MMADYLRSKGRDVLVTKADQASEFAADIYAALKKPTQRTTDSEWLAFMAMLVEHANYVIAPALYQNIDVLCDRYIYSTIAYQTRDTSNSCLLGDACNVNYMPTPNKAFFIDVPFESLRMAKGDDASVFERRGEDYLHEVMRFYRMMSGTKERGWSENIRCWGSRLLYMRMPPLTRINGVGTPEEVHERIKEKLKLDV